ncbi:MAG: PAS domain S-box protein, partial [Bacteroidetes bacterium]
MFGLGFLGLLSGFLIHEFLPNAYYPAYIYATSAAVCIAVAVFSFFIPHVRRHIFDYASFCYLFMYLGIVYITYRNDFNLYFTLILLASHVFFAISFRNFVEYTIFAIASLSLFILSLWMPQGVNQQHIYLLISVFTLLTIFAGIRVWLREQAHKRMSNGSHLLSDLLNSSQYAVFLLDEQCKKIHYLNTTAIKYLQVLTGYATVDHQELFNLLGIDPAFVVNRFRSAPYSLQEKGFCTIESYNGQEIYFELYISKVRSLEGDNILIRLLDITEHRRREKHLKRSISVNESLVHAIPDMLIRINTQGIIQSVRTSDLLPDISISENFVGQHFMDILRPLSPRENHQQALVLFEKAKVEGGVQQMELTVQRKHKKQFFDLRLVRLEEEDEILAIVRDMTRAKEIQLALKQSEQNYREIFNSGNDGIILADLNTLLPIDVNRVTYSILGYNALEFKKLPVHTLCKPSDAAGFAQGIKLARKGEPQTITCQFIRKDDQLVWVEVSIKCTEIGGKARMMFILRDVEERIDFTQKIQRYADLFESVDMGMVVMQLEDPTDDSSFRFVSCNQFAENLIGAQSSLITGKRIDEVLPFLRQADIPARMKAALEAGEILIEDDLLHPDKHGTPQYWQIKATPLSGGYVGVLLENITERKQATERLKYQALLADSVSDAIISTRPDFTIESWNKAAEDIYGWKAEEVTGKNLAEIFQGVYVNDSREAAMNKLFAEGFWEGEIIQERKNGEKITVLSSASVITDDQGEASRVVILNRNITAQKERELLIKKSEQK